MVYIASPNYCCFQAMILKYSNDILEKEILRISQNGLSNIQVSKVPPSINDIYLYTNIYPNRSPLFPSFLLYLNLYINIYISISIIEMTPLPDIQPLIPPPYRHTPEADIYLYLSCLFLASLTSYSLWTLYSAWTTDRRNPIVVYDNMNGHPHRD